MGDEDVIRRRLIIDGDGTGDDRRLNLLLKSFMKWSSSTDSQVESQEIQDRMLSQLAQSGYQFSKSRSVSLMSAAELENYENLSKQIECRLEEAKQKIEETKADFKNAKTVRKNRVEYEVLAKVINEQPDRKQTNEKLTQLKKELQSLEETSEELDKKFEMRRKQFHVLIASVHYLQAMLNQSSQDELMDTALDNFDDEDLDILSQKAEPDSTPMAFDEGH